MARNPKGKESAPLSHISTTSRYTSPGFGPRRNQVPPFPAPSYIDIDIHTDIDSDVEFFPGNLPPATHSQINRFTEVTSLPPKQSAKRLHQHRDLVTGTILFDEALAAFFEGGHDHEDDDEYVYGEEGCFCLERAAEKVLDEVFRGVREELGREQGDFEGMLDGVRRVLELGWEGLGVPFVIWEAVMERFKAIWREWVGEVVSLHEASFRRVQRLKPEASRH